MHRFGCVAGRRNDRFAGRRIFALVAISLFAAAARTHPGGVDSNGCHNDRKAGERHCHPERLVAKSLSSCERKPPAAGDEGVFFGKLVRVADGDTFEVKVQGVVMDFRLAEADAPEKDQPYGEAARKELYSLLRGQSIVLAPIDTDRYGRTVVFAWVGAQCINKEMIRRGAAWFYTEFAQGNAMQFIEEEARDAKTGLWALPLPQRVEPWVWRDRPRKPRRE